MELNINIKSTPIKFNEFSFSNIKSELGATSLYFTKKDKPFIPISGEFHFSRYDYRDWERAILKMKSSGINTIATYVFWNYHEYNKGEFDFSGNKNIKLFLSLCKKHEIYCHLRLGPWAHGECMYGGFPPFIQKMIGKRKDNPKYLAEVERFWTRLYQEVKDYCDGKTVIGIQLENEYGGNISHIHTLRKLVEKIGYKTPFFTMTAWPTNTPDKSFLPTFGGYPDAPWSHLKSKLKPAGRFAISKGRMESEIGEDLVQTVGKKASFAGFPYAGCEVGTGNQVTQHRRPLITTLDGYGIPFSKVASGMNWIGYYIYYGGRNPNNRPMQESRRTLYPNNLPMIDYDFQSPFGKNGEKRKHCDKLRLLHTFLTEWDKNLALKDAYFGTVKPCSGEDNTIPYYSVRCDETLSGYCFISNYERGRSNADIKDVNIVLNNTSKKLALPSLTIKANAVFFYPFNFNINNIKVDYILAQPIVECDNILYFTEIDGIAPVISINDKVTKINGNYILKTNNGEKTIKILSEKQAMQLFYLNGKVLFSENNLYILDGKITEEKLLESVNKATLSPTNKEKLPYGYYLYSFGKRKYYKLTIDKDLLKNDDIELKLNFSGLNLQVFAGEQIIDDYFNTDGIYTIRLKFFYDYLKKNNELIIKTVPPMSFGVGKVYNEINLTPKNNELSILTVKPIKYVEKLI